MKLLRNIGRIIVDPKCRSITFDYNDYFGGECSIPNHSIPTAHYCLVKDFVAKFCSLFNQNKLTEVNKLCLLNRNHNDGYIEDVCVCYLKGIPFVKE